jgi:hypothetical protein
MNRNLLLISALAIGLAGPLAAQAQQVNPPATDAAPAAPAAPQTDATAPAAATPATQAAAPVSATTDAGNTQVVANAPIPDTPANRAKYGHPMSRAGKMTKPAGN